MEKTVIFAVASVLEENHVTQKQASVRSGVLLATAMMTECASQVFWCFARNSFVMLT